MKMKNKNVWFMSDPHFGHKNLVRGVTSWEHTEGCRNYDTIDEMNEAIVDGINNNVKKDDILFCLGDWSFGGFDNIQKFRSMLDVSDLHMVLGNHDNNILTNRGDVQQLFSSVRHYRKVFVNDQEIIMCHYPIISWEDSHKGSWMLHGHMHGTLPEKSTIQWAGDDYWVKTGKMFDVGMDVALDMLGEYRPFHFDEIRDVMKGREFEIEQDLRTRRFRNNG